MNYLAILALLVLSAATLPHMPDIQGHRGCHGLMAENTIPAMRRALDLGVTTLKIDIAISQDKQVLLSHDAYLNADFVYQPEPKPRKKT